MIAATVILLLHIRASVTTDVNVLISQFDEPQQCQDFFHQFEELLNLTSHGIWSWSQGITHLETINVVIPSSWNIAHCLGPRDVKSGQLRRPDIVVTESQHYVSDDPWSLQHLDCGHTGLQLSVSRHFVLQQSQARERMMMREWLKYRYGVFEEMRGFHNDKIYREQFNNGTDTEETSGCSDDYDDEEIFCDQLTNLNLLAPTKQNLLCHGESARKIIFSHPDFIKSNNINSSHSSSFTPPVFQYILPRTGHYSLVLDLSSGLQSSWQHVRKSVFRFIQTLPLNSSISIVSQDVKPRLLLPQTVITNINKDDITSRLPRRVSSQDRTCVKCALELGIQSLRDYRGDIKEGVVVLITGDQPRSIKLGDLLQYSSVRIFTIALTDDQIPQDFYTLSSSGGAVWAVNSWIKRNMLSSHVSEVLMEVMNMVEEEKLVKITSRVYHQTQVESTFSVEYGLTGDLFIMLVIDDEMKVAQFELTDPRGNNNIFSQFDTGLVYFRVNNGSEAGVWSYRVKLYDNIQFPSDGFTVDVSAGVSGDDGVLVTAGDNVVTGDQLPVIIWTRVTRRGDPIIGALVEADITGPGGFSDHVMMTDTGTGYPDITGSDGVYTGYLSSLAPDPGQYSVRILVSDHQGAAVAPRRRLTSHHDTAPLHPSHAGQCCGSKLPLHDIVPTGHFYRIIAGRSFYISAGSDDDVAPPSRIIDLSLADQGSYKNSSMEVMLTWTAPGGDYQRGSAARYEIRTATKMEYLTDTAEFEDKGILIHPSLTPTPSMYGATETCTVRVPWPNEVFYYAVIGVDESGNRGEISNLVAVFIHEETTTTTTSTTTTTTTTTTSATTTTTTRTSTTTQSRIGQRRADIFRWKNPLKVETTPANVVFLPTRLSDPEVSRKRLREIQKKRYHDRTRQPRVVITPAPLPEGFLSIRDLFEADILKHENDIDDHGDHDRFERNTRNGRRENNYKDEVYAIVGAGGSFVVLTVLLAFFIVKRYRMKMMEAGNSDTFRRNSVDFSPSFQHAQPDDANSFNKIYSLVRNKTSEEEDGKPWLNPMAKLGSDAGSEESSKTTVDVVSETEDRARSAGEVMNVVQEKSKDTTSEETSENKSNEVSVKNSSSKKEVWGVPNNERGKLLLEIYNGGTFKKSMNYHSFRDTSDKTGRQSREVSIDNLETDSLEVSGSQLTVLPPSEISRRSRLSDIFPDILNFKNSPERHIPSPDYDDDEALSTISEKDNLEKNDDEKPVKHTQYYYGDHAIEKGAEDSEHTGSKVKFNLDLSSAIVRMSRQAAAPAQEDSLSSLDILPEMNTRPTLNRAHIRKKLESQSSQRKKSGK